MKPVKQAKTKQRRPAKAEKPKTEAPKQPKKEVVLPPEVSLSQDPL